MSYVLAIDVGTSYTAAALLRPSGSPAPTPEILPLGLHGSAVPSVLFYAGDGRILVGEAAERRGLDDPGRVVREFKRRIGDAVPLAVGEAWLAPEDVYATLARWVVDRAEEREGSSPSSIIMTHPASWGGHRTATVLAALNLAGLTDVTLISEPVAAALHYAAQTRVEDGSTVAVYDLGGGTFDTAVLRKAAAGTFELLGRPNGIETLGGADFDAAVLRHVIAHLGEAIDGLDPEDPESKASLSRLRRECREAKEALSMDSETSIAVALPGTQRTLRLVRSEFEALIEAPIRETVHALERSLCSIDVEPAELSAVLLIGGSSRIPLVAGMISVELDRPIAVDADPKSSICLGAAIAGAGISAAMDAEAVASAVPVTAPSAAPGAPRPHVVARPHLGGTAGAKFAAAKNAATPGHSPRARLRLAAAAVTAATALTIATATAAQTPEGNGLLASMFGNQAADVMRGDGTTAAGAHANGGGGGAPGAAPAVGSPTAGLEASAKAGVTRSGTGTGKSPARSGSAGTGASGTGAGTGAGSVGGSTAGAGTGGAAGTGSTGGTAGTGGTAAAGGSTGTGGGTAPGTPGSGTTPTPEPTGGAASGPTPPPATTPPPSTTPPTVPPPATDPTTPPVGSDPSVPPPSTDPTVPQPEPTAPQDPATQNPAPPAPEPTVPQQEPTQPAAPAPIPSETSPNPDPALTPAA